MSLDYKKVGVNIEAGDALVDWLKNRQTTSKRPHQDRIVGGLGGFAALFRAGFPEMKSPCLVSSTDGIGTKLKLAVHFESYRTVAQDLVAMCVNDLVCCGAMPLFFLDYYACGQLRLDAAKEFLGGIQDACHESDCALIGGETAEMPGVYSAKDFDAAGFSVGVVDETEALGAHRVKNGDQIIAVASSGFHSNGFSLIRKVFADDIDDWKEILLTPTHLYVRLVKEMLKNQGSIKAIANITGGGLDNLLRVVPQGSVLHLKAWDIPEPFLEVERRAEMNRKDLLKTLNCGIGMAFFVEKDQVAAVLETIKKQNFKGFALGEVQITPGNTESSWMIEDSV